MRIPRRLPVYPMGDNEDFFFGTDNDVNMYWNGTYLEFVGNNAELQFNFATAGTTAILGGITSGDALKLQANSIDATPYINMVGTSHIYLNVPAGQSVLYYSAATQFLDINYWGNECNILSTVNGKDLRLQTTGGGKISFGVVTGGGDVLCNGTLAMKDAAGNAIKVMLTA